LDGIHELVHYPHDPETHLFESLATGQISDGLVVEAEYSFGVGACFHCGAGEEDGKFVVPSGEYAEWEVDLAIRNPSLLIPWLNWEATLDFGPELEVALVSLSSNSKVNITEDPGTGKTRATWSSNGLLPGKGEAKARLKISTRSPDHYGKSGQYVFANNIKLSYFRLLCCYHVGLDPIYVNVEAAPPSASVSASATRLDWRVQKPGTYAALATTVTASGIGTLSMQFSKFADLSGTGGVPGTISTFYGFGDDLAAAEAGEWISAAELNNKTRHIDLSEPVPVLMWSKIIVGDQNSSAEYENKGEITFIVSNNSIGNGGSK